MLAIAGGEAQQKIDLYEVPSGKRPVSPAPARRSTKRWRSSRDPVILARAALGAGGRFYMPVTSDPAYVARLEEALAALGDAEGPLRARPRGAWPSTSRSPAPVTGRRSTAPRRWRWPAASATTGRSPPP